MGTVELQKFCDSFPLKVHLEKGCPDWKIHAIFLWKLASSNTLFTQVDPHTHVVWSSNFLYTLYFEHEPLKWKKLRSNQNYKIELSSAVCAASDQNLEVAAWESRIIWDFKDTRALHDLSWGQSLRNRKLCTQWLALGILQPIRSLKTPLPGISTCCQCIESFMDVSPHQRLTVWRLWQWNMIHLRSGRIGHLR